jgi:hypothetical protein
MLPRAHVRAGTLLVARVGSCGGGGDRGGGSDLANASRPADVEGGGSFFLLWPSCS